MKKLFFYLLPLSFIFSANIGIVHLKPYIYATSPPIAKELMEILRSKGHNVELADLATPNVFKKYDLLLTQIVKAGLLPYKDKTILYMQEPPVVVKEFEKPSIYKNFLISFNWEHDSCNGCNLKKSFFPNYTGLRPEFPPFEERKLSCLINSNLGFIHRKQLYSKRAGVARYYLNNAPEDLDLYGGRGWNKKQFPNYKGIVKDKHKEMSQHKFCYVYENWDNDQYYISEKILHCLESRCVPIYLGSSKIDRYIPKECYIDVRQFNSNRRIHEFIKNMDEETWLSYIHAIEEFDRSENAKLFTKEAYFQRMCDAVNEALEKLGIE